MTVLRHRAATQLGEVASGMRLRQVHRPGPLTRDQPWQIGLLERFGTIHFQRFDRADREQRAK